MGDMNGMTYKAGKLFLVTAFVLIVIVAANGQKSVADGNGEWKEYVSKEAGFKALFPGEPTFSSAVVMTVPIKRTNNRFEVSLEQGYFAVHYSDHPQIPDLEKNDLQANYDFVQRTVGKLTGAEIFTQREVNLGKRLGREVIFKKQDEAIIVRIYLIDARLYQNIVSISFADYESGKLKDEISKFFDSFTLIEKK